MWTMEMAKFPAPKQAEAGFTVSYPFLFKLSGQ